MTIENRKVGLLFGVAIFFAPYIFSWFTFAKGYSTLTRSISIGWSLFFIFTLSIAHGIFYAFPFVAIFSIYLIIRSHKKDKAESQTHQNEIEKIVNARLIQIKPKKALIKSDEIAYCAVPAKMQEVKTVGYGAGTAGASVRIAKGITLRGGGIKGGAIKQLTTTSTGELVITDQRIIFAGDAKSFAVSHEKIISTTNYTDGFGFSDGDKTYNLLIENEKDCIAFSATFNKVVVDKQAQQSS